MLPKQDCTILDTGDSLGLRATASHDFVVEDAFVPQHRQLAFPGGRDRFGQLCAVGGREVRSELPRALWRADLRCHHARLAENSRANDAARY